LLYACDNLTTEDYKRRPIIEIFVSSGMTPLREMSYEEFGKLRFLDFFPRQENYAEEHEGGLEAGIGIACHEGYGFTTAFLSPADSEWQTSEILLTFENGECPVAEGNAFLQGLGLGLRKGMTQAEVKELLGNPERTFPLSLGMNFVVGEEWPYFVGCTIKADEGLVGVWICRKDLADEQAELES